MIFIIGILTLLFAVASFIMIKTKRYKEFPFISVIMFISFIGFTSVLIITYYLPYGKILLLPLSCSVMGLLVILLAINDLYSIFTCNTKIEGTYCGYNTYYGSNGVSTQAPVFEYTYDDKYYHEQSAQNVSYKQLARKMSEGEVYPIYINQYHPAIFILNKKLKVSTFFFFLLGIFFLCPGIVTLINYLHMFY